MGIIAPKLQIFITRASCKPQPLTCPWRSGPHSSWQWGGWRENCWIVYYFKTFKKVMNVQTARKKEPSVRWLRVGIENSNNFSLKKSTLDTLLLRTYKQTELLCTHINTHSSVLPWLSPCRASGSCRHLQRTPQVPEPGASSPESFGCQNFHAWLVWDRQGQGEKFPSRLGPHLALRLNHTGVWSILAISLRFRETDGSCVPMSHIPRN